MASATILTIGNELVSGDVANTNAAWLARRLEALGVSVHLIAALPDEIDPIAEFVRHYAPRSDYLLVTGGTRGAPVALTDQRLPSPIRSGAEEGPPPPRGPPHRP